MTYEVWTVAREERLKQLWADGWSAAQIANDLGGFENCCGAGRSAVIGKVHRMKLAPRRTQVRRPMQKPLPPGRAVVLRPKPSGKAGPPERRNPSNSLAEKLAIMGAEPGLTERLKGEAPDGTGIQIRDLTKLNCHWPKGDPKEADFEFCGARALPGMPYCAAHCRLSYRPPGPRRADRAL